MKIGIIGMGWVGSSVAISTLHSGIVSELLLNDVRHEVAEGEAMDLQHGSSFYPNARVRTAAVEDMREADAVVIAAGRGSKPGESRLDLLQDTANIAADIGRRLQGARGLVIVVSNPVDVLTQIVGEASDLDPARVMGTGTMLDTARLREMVGRKLRLDPRSVHAQVIGEHGDSEVVLWSSARVGGLPLRKWKGWSPDDEPLIRDQVRRAAAEIIARKGATNHAIGLVTAALLRWGLRSDRRVLTVSRLQEGAGGFRDVAMSLPSVVDWHGATEVIVPEWTKEEQEAAEASAEILRRARAQISL